MHTGNIVVTGKRIEEELFGRAVLEDRVPQYEPYAKALASIKTMPSNGSPENPLKDFAKLLRLEVANILCPQELVNIKFFTAVGSSFDRWHGVDAVIEYITAAGNVIIATIDVTKKTDKPDGKADIIFTVPKDGLPDYPKAIRDSYDQYDKNEFCKYVNLLTGQIIKVIKNKLALTSVKQLVN